MITNIPISKHRVASMGDNTIKKLGILLLISRDR